MKIQPFSLCIGLLALFVVAAIGSHALAQQPSNAPTNSVAAPAPASRQLDLFYNYYMGTSGGSRPAAMYPAPRPVPAVVGHVYYTYQPFLPHEYMYSHHREYFTYYGNYYGYGACAGMPSINHTIVRYQRGTILPLYKHHWRPPMVPQIPCGNCNPAY